MLTHEKKEKYRHEKLLELYLEDPLKWRKYLSDHIWYFISHTKWNVAEADYHWTASEAISTLDHQITKQIKKFWPKLNPIKMWKYLIIRLWWHLMNLHISNSRVDISTYNDDCYEIPCNQWYDDFDWTLSLLGLTEMEQMVVSMKMRWAWERVLMRECGLNRKWIRQAYDSWIEKVRKFYISQWIGWD